MTFMISGIVIGAVGSFVMLTYLVKLQATNTTKKNKLRSNRAEETQDSPCRRKDVGKDLTNYAWKLRI